MGSPNTQRAKIDVVSELDDGAKALRAMLKELKQVNTAKKRKEVLDKDIGAKVFELASLIVLAIEGKAIAADPLGLITGKTVFGEPVDTHSKAWMASQDPTRLLNCQRTSVLSGKTGGLWNTIKINFVNGATWIYDKAKATMTIIWNGIKTAVLWVWEKAQSLYAWVKAKLIGIWNWFAGFFRNKGDTINAQKAEDMKDEHLKVLDDGEAASFTNVITPDDVVDTAPAPQTASQAPKPAAAAAAAA